MIYLYCICGIIGFLLVFLLLGFIPVKLMQNKMFNFHQYETTNPCFLTFENYKDNLTREEFKIDLDKNNYLKGFFYQKKGETSFKGFIILVHGYGGTHLQYLLDINFLCNLGYKVMAFDQLGVGESSGKSQVDLAKGAETLNFVINYVVENNINENLKIILYGHSWGGYSVICGATEDVDMIISRSGFVNPVKIMATSLKKMGFFTTLIIPSAYLYYLLFHHRRSFKDAYKNYNKLAKQPKTLILYAKDDTYVYEVDSLSKKFIENPNKNVTVFQTDTGGHNTILSKEGLQKHKQLLEKYEKVKDDEVKKEEFIKNLNLTKDYTLNDEHSKKITEFLQ